MTGWPLQHHVRACQLEDTGVLNILFAGFDFAVNIDFKKGQLIPIIVGKAKFVSGSDTIQINSYPFIPIIDNKKVYYFGKQNFLFHDESISISKLKNTNQSTSDYVLYSKIWNYEKYIKDRYFIK